MRPLRQEQAETYFTMSKVKFTIPLYDAVLWLVVADNINRERKKMEHIFGAAPEEPDYAAICSYSGGHTFALFFEREELTTTIVAHEVFHLTHRIMDWAGCHFDKDHHEQGALLHGYLMALVLKRVKPRKMTQG